MANRRDRQEDPNQYDPQSGQVPQPAPPDPAPAPFHGGQDAANQPVPMQGGVQPQAAPPPRPGAPMEGKFPNSFVNLQAYLYANPGASAEQLGGVVSPGNHSMAGVGSAAPQAQATDQPGGTLASGGGVSGNSYSGVMSTPQRSGLPVGNASQGGQPQGAATGGQNMSTPNNVQGANYVQAQRRTLFPRLASLLSQG